jgi:hypothetical protein
MRLWVQGLMPLEQRVLLRLELLRVQEPLVQRQRLLHPTPTPPSLL